ncbi:MAG: hypothetical protein EOO54_20590, partial [Haliea sp.]
MSTKHPHDATVPHTPDDAHRHGHDHDHGHDDAPAAPATCCGPAGVTPQAAPPAGPQQVAG